MVANRHRWEAVARHRSHLIAHARRSGAGTDAEDVAQEALINAYLSPVMDETDPAPYLKRLVESLARSRHRRNSTAANAVRRLAGPRPTGTPVEDHAVLHDLASRAVRRLRMTESPRTADMVLRRVGGAGWSEIAIEFGVTAGAAESRVRYALLLLRHWLDRRLPC